MLDATQQQEVVKWMPLAAKIARTFGKDDDFQATAMLALCEAIDEFDGSCPIEKWIGIKVRQACGKEIKKRGKP